MVAAVAFTWVGIGWLVVLGNIVWLAFPLRSHLGWNIWAIRGERMCDLVSYIFVFFLVMVSLLHLYVTLSTMTVDNGFRTLAYQ